MMRFEQFVIEEWKDWDNFGNDYYFYDCKLNPSFWAGKEADLQDIYAKQEILGKLPVVYFTFDETGFMIQVYFEDLVNDNGPVWAYQGIISRGTKLDY